MYIVFFLFMAANLLAQESYVIDSVCVGAERFYRHDGQEGYTYDWYIIDKNLSDTMWLSGVDYDPSNGTDTIWGNEIFQLWDAVGLYNIVVEVYTEHGCDTLEQGDVKVFPLPEAYAGEDMVICNPVDIIPADDTAQHFSVLYWATTGDGTFDDEYSLHPTYTIGPNDILAGGVTLILTAEGLADNGTCIPAVDSVNYLFSKPEIELTKLDPLCYNDSNATVTVNVLIGQPPFRYDWEGPAGFTSVNSPTIDNLWAGTYRVLVTDANDCTDTASIEVINPDPLRVTIDTVGLVSCFAYADGFIMSSATGGTDTLSFHWESLLGLSFDTDDIIDLPADTYYLTVTDVNLCTAEDSVYIPQPDSMLVAISVGDSLLCVDEATVLNGNPLGGTGTLTHEWTGSGSVYLDSTTTPNVIFSNAPDGTYLLIYTITDEASCMASDSIEITVYPPTYSIDSMELCAGEAPFAWNNLMIYADHDSTYLDTLFGMNQYGCDSMLTLEVKVLFPTPLDTAIYLCASEEPFVMFTNTIIPGIDSTYLDTMYYSASGCDSLYVKLEVYTLPVTDTLIDTTLCEASPEFVWNSHTISTYTDSTYLDTLTNMYGCDSTITLNVYIVPGFKDTSQLAVCFGEAVAAWFGQAISSEFDSTYFHQIPDPFGCDTLLYYEVSILPVSDSVLDSTLCAGLPDFMWNNRLISSARDSIYLDTLTNSFGCDSLLTYNVFVIPPDTFETDTLLCYGDPSYDWNGITISTLIETSYQAILSNAEGCDSVVILTVQLLNGTTRDTFISACEEYTWVDGTGTTYNTSGIYLHTVGDGSACADSVWLHLTISPPIFVIPDPTDVLCFGDSTGAINLTVSGGTKPYSYFWSPGGETTRDLANLPAGTYSVTITDSIGCTWDRDFIISEPAEIQITLDAITDVLVNGQSTGSIEVTVSGGTPVYAYEWTNLAGTVVGTNEDLFNQPAGDYTLTVTDANGCVISETYTITEPEVNVCLNDTTFTCYEDLATYPLITSLEDYMALLQPGQVINPGCGIDTSSFTFTSVIDAASAFCYEEVRLYALLDDCGDTLFSCEQHVIVDDTEKPTISCPPTITIVNDVIPLAYADSTEFLLAGGTFGDNCAVVSFRQVGGDVSLGGTDPERIQRTYEVADYCGNVSTCTQIIEVYLTSDFTIECIGLPSVVYDCVGSLPRYNLGNLQQNLDDFRNDGGYAYSYPLDIVSFTYREVSDNADCPETITRTFTIRNESGDETSCTVVYRIVDDLPPTLVLPDKYIACNESWPFYSNYVDVLRYRDSHGNDAFDNCGNSSIRAVTLVSNTLVETCPTVYERVYRIRDYCNNFSLQTERIIIEEQPLEVISAPVPLAEDCYLPDPYATIAAFEADGGKVNVYCGATLTFDHIGDASAGAGEPGVVYRTYRFWDNCDSVDVIQKITIIDSIPPVLTCPPADTLALGESFPDNPFVTLDEFLGANGFAQDNCTLDSSSLTLVRKDSLIGDCEAQYIYTFIISDLSGNWSEECDHIIYKLDQSDPQLFCPPGTSVQCFDDIEPAYTTFAEFVAAGGSATDDYGLDMNSFRLLSQTAGNTNCPTIVTRTYLIEDLCGNQATCEQYITVTDTIPPTIICPPGGSAVCLTASLADIETLEDFESNGGSVDDNCEVDRSSFTYSRITNKQINQSEVITTYYISDMCGNIDSCIQVFILTDTIPPDAVCNEITVYLDENGNYLMTEIDMDNISAGSSDNCTAFDDLIIDVIPEEVSCEDVEEGKEVTVVVTDEAGNWDDCIANIIVLDTLPPVALCQNITVYLDENGRATITPYDVDDGSYDNCLLEGLQVSPSLFDCTNVGDNVVQLIATDAYGLTDTCEAIVTVIDQIPPVIACVPGDTIVLGSDGTYLLSWEIITASVSDECGIDTVLLDNYLLDCDNIGLTTITATAFDVNGNFSSCETTFVIIGNTPPNVQNDSAVTAINVPVDINVVLNDYDLKTNINLSTLGIINNPSHGSVSVDNKTGIVTYTPDPGYVGEDKFYYEICDDGIPCVPECGSAIVFITVRPANLPPVAVDDYYDLACGIDLNANVMVNDSDPDGDNTFVEIILLTHPVNGIAIMLDEYGNFEYSPNYDFKEGVDSFQYILFDDGIPSLSDTAWVYITRVADNDCDGIADVDDIDDDNDGIRDVNEGLNEEYPALSVDSDQDGIPDYLDVDSDNDGILDNIEGQAEDNYIEPDGWRDDNHNGWDDRYDDDEGGYPFDLDLTDTDEDGTPDYLDSDSDNDGVYDFIEGNDEIGPNFIGDGIPDLIRFYTDLDFDGLDDAYDWIDGWGNYVDNEIGSLSPLQDSDNDGTRDWRDVNDEDDEFLTVNEDINGDGDYSNDDLDLDGTPEYLDVLMECDLFIPEGFSPNNDGVHDFFQILCTIRVTRMRN